MAHHLDAAGHLNLTGRPCVKCNRDALDRSWLVYVEEVCRIVSEMLLDELSTCPTLGPAVAHWDGTVI